MFDRRKLPVIRRIRTRFLWLHLGIGMVVTLVAATGIGLTDYFGQRRAMLDDFTHLVTTAGELSLVTGQATAATLLAFHAYDGLHLLCVYSPEGALLAAWQAAARSACPALPANSEMDVSFFKVRLSQPILQDGHYAGLVYAEGELHSLRHWLFFMSYLLGGLLLLAGIACGLSSYFAARAILQPLLAVQRQIACLKENEVGFCPLPSSTGIHEIIELSKSVTALRNHLASTLVPKEAIRQLHQWHWDVLTGLLTGLRYRINADSPLLEDVSDYALLLQTERGDLLPPPTAFTMREILHRSLQSARAAYPPDARMNLTASTQSHMPERWLGHAEILGAIFRHLLLIGLKRTRKGYVCLRLEYAPPAVAGHPHRLHLHYEDSGAPMQPGQLHQLLQVDAGGIPALGHAHDIGWLLVSRLMARLGGTLVGHSRIDQGIALDGILTMALAEPVALAPAALSPLPLRQSAPPLLLVVEPIPETRKAMARLFAGIHCHAIMVETHAQAVELAPLLPVSSVVLHAQLTENGDDSPRRLRHLMEDGAMPEIPLWVTLTQLSFIEFDYWRKRGIKELLLLPLQPDILARLCQTLPGPDPAFYAAHDVGLREEFPETTRASLPAMNAMLREQINALEPPAASLADGLPGEAAIHQAHAIKSAALTLGYFRLAGVMDQWEHAAESSIFASYPENWNSVIAAVKMVRFERV